MNILIAEDDPILQMLNRRMMDRWGYHFDIASNGAEAVEYVEKNPRKYDLCLMDVEMPVMNGIDATRIIRRKAAWFPIMAITANDATKKQCLDVGMDEFTEKPCRPRDLFVKINELTVKVAGARRVGNGLSLMKETPMDAEQLKELRALDKKNLALLIIESGLQRFVVHKNIQNKMSHILVGEGKELFEFLDRSDTPANCHLYRCNLQTNRLLLTPEQFAERVRIENNDINHYADTIDQEFSSEKNQ